MGNIDHAHSKPPWLWWGSASRRRIACDADFPSPTLCWWHEIQEGSRRIEVKWSPGSFYSIVSCVRSNESHDSALEGGIRCIPPDGNVSTITLLAQTSTHARCSCVIGIGSQRWPQERPVLLSGKIHYLAEFLTIAPLQKTVNWVVAVSWM